MRIVFKAAQAAACLAVLAAGAFHGARAEEAAAPAAQKPNQPAARSLNRTLLSIGLPAARQDQRPGAMGNVFDVRHTTDRAWYAKVANSNPNSPAASAGMAVVGSGHDNEVWGYDLVTGKRKWSARSDDSGISSIVISGDSAYFTTYSCTLERVLVASGAHKFRKWISPTVECAPDVAGDTAYASYRGGKSHVISAHNISGGGEKWKSDAPGNVIYAPVVNNGHLFVATTDGKLASFDAATGRQAWSRSTGALSAPVVSSYGLLVVTATAPDEASSLPAPAPKPEVSADDKPTTKPDPKDDRKTESTPAPKAPEQIMPTKEIGKTLASEGNRRLALMSSKSQPVGGTDIQLSGPTGYGLSYIGPRPAVDDELAVIALGSRVIAIDMATDTVKWELQVETKHGNFCQPAFGDNMVILADNYGFVTAVERNTGNLVWSYRMEGQGFTGTPAIADNRVVLTTDRGLMVCLPTGAKQGKKDHKPADSFKKAVVESGGVNPARDEAPKHKAPTAKAPASGQMPGATPIEPPAEGVAPAPETEEAPEVAEDPYEGLPEDKRVGPGGIAPPKAGPGGIAPREAGPGGVGVPKAGPGGIAPK